MEAINDVNLIFVELLKGNMVILDHDIPFDREDEDFATLSQ